MRPLFGITHGFPRPSASLLLRSNNNQPSWDSRFGTAATGMLQRVRLPAKMVVGPTQRPARSVPHDVNKLTIPVEKDANSHSQTCGEPPTGHLIVLSSPKIWPASGTASHPRDTVPKRLAERIRLMVALAM